MNKNKDIKTLIDLSSKINVMHLAYTTKLGFYAKKVNVSIQKINTFYLDIFRIVIANCLVKNKLGKVQFF